MRRSKSPQYSYIVIIAAVSLLAVIIYLQLHESNPHQAISPVNSATVESNSDTPLLRNKQTTEKSTTNTPTETQNKNLSTPEILHPDTQQLSNHPPLNSIQIVPSLTIGLPSENSTTSKTNLILRKKYLAAVRSGTWPDPNAKKQQKTKTAALPTTATDKSTQIIHTVQSGESLSSISKKYYKDPNKWRVIYNANKKIIGSKPNLLRAGQKLIIPSQ